MAPLLGYVGLSQRDGEGWEVWWPAISSGEQHRSARRTFTPRLPSLFQPSHAPPHIMAHISGFQVIAHLKNEYNTLHSLLIYLSLEGQAPVPVPGAAFPSPQALIELDRDAFFQYVFSCRSYIITSMPHTATRTAPWSHMQPILPHSQSVFGSIVGSSRYVVGKFAPIFPTTSNRFHWLPTTSAQS